MAASTYHKVIYEEFRQFAHSNHARYSRPIHDSTWERYKPEIERMYIHEGKTRREVRAILGEEYNFNLT